ncbi:3-deoxy-manno-octulosonate cytidylyltransferase [bacterium]|nr:3-deoxy-manno-octulosonate cytidylyltransferase [bacterium]
MKTVAVIPARWASRRFPGKPLAPILGKPMIAWVIEAARRASRIHDVFVATDDDRIATAAHAAGADVRMTSADCATGTDRVAEAVAGLDADIVKIVVDDHGDALYFSRAPIPYRNVEAGAPTLSGSDREMQAWRHVGTYGFRVDALREFVAAPREGLESLEDLEQLRALRLGWKIRVVEVVREPICVDRPEDVAKVETMLRSRSEGVTR